MLEMKIVMALIMRDFEITVAYPDLDAEKHGWRGD